MEKSKYNYIHAYNKDNYTKITLQIRENETRILNEYCNNLGLSKNAIFQKCLVYCYDNMIDVSKVEISKK